MTKLNCWEFKKCGRNAGGGETGACPAATDVSCTGLNDGNKAGRICWAVAGTFCGGKVQGDFAKKSVSCMSCDFFRTVKREQGEKFLLLRAGQQYGQSIR
ncbi:MAG: hypothetical protein HZA16_09685 [Nitrospirae bacterium]|nr:hypothetical protein [Nitrospirota bacterium]